MNVVWTLTRHWSCNWIVDDINTCQWILMHCLVLKFMKEQGHIQCRAIRWSILWFTEILKWRPSLRSKTLLFKVQKFSKWIVLNAFTWMCVCTHSMGLNFYKALSNSINYLSMTSPCLTLTTYNNRLPVSEVAGGCRSATELTIRSALLFCIVTSMMFTMQMYPESLFHTVMLR